MVLKIREKKFFSTFFIVSEQWVCYVKKSHCIYIHYTGWSTCIVSFNNNLFKIWFIEFLNIPNENIFKFLRFLFYLKNDLWIRNFYYSNMNLFFTLNYLVDNFSENVYAEHGGYSELKIVIINIH